MKIFAFSYHSLGRGLLHTRISSLNVDFDILGTLAYRSICLKDQMSEFLPALLQITHGIEGCGLLEVIRRSPDIWQAVFGHSFEITAAEFLEQLHTEYSFSQIKNADVDTFKFFCGAIENLDGGILGNHD